MADRRIRQGDPHQPWFTPTSDTLPGQGDEVRARLGALFRAVAAPLAHVPRVLRTYGDAAYQMVYDSPYSLVRDVSGFPFAAADRLAALRRTPADQPERLSVALWALLDEAARQEGHVFLPRAELIGRGMALLGLPRAVVSEALAASAASGDVWLEGPGPDRAPEQRSDDAVYLLPLYRAEAALARRIGALTAATDGRLAVFHDAPWDRAFDWLARRHGLALHDDERTAVRTMLTARLSVVAAPRGGRWPMVVRAALALARAKRIAAHVVATTVLAAQHARTALQTAVHTLAPGADVPAEVGLVIVLHADQLDLWQAHALAEALPDGAHLALVGDPRTLPPLGPGWPFADLAAQAVEVALAPRAGDARAPLVALAERIARGEPLHHPLTSNEAWLYQVEDAEQARAAVLELVAERLPRRRRIPPYAIAVLCLARHGAAGAAELGAALRARLERSSAAVRTGAQPFRPGERVILAEALPRLGLPQGTLARVAGLAGPHGGLRLVLPDGRAVAIEEADLPALAHATALPVAQAQGGPFRAVVVPVLADDYVALTRRALYAAASSAAEVCVLVGQERALDLALASDRTPVRYRRLAERLGPAR